MVHFSARHFSLLPWYDGPKSASCGADFLQFYANWATMSQPDDDLVVVPFSMLPSESESNPDPKKIENEKQLIRDLIVNKTNEQIVSNPEAWDELLKIGGDTMINAFACNFKLNGKLNEDIVSIRAHRP